jgi:hypothetical protein
MTKQQLAHSSIIAAHLFLIRVAFVAAAVGQPAACAANATKTLGCIGRCTDACGMCLRYRSGRDRFDDVPLFVLDVFVVLPR